MMLTSFYMILFNALLIILIISLPILVALAVIRAVGRSIRGDREPFEKEIRSLLDKIRENQEETNRLLRQHLADGDNDTR